MSFIKSFFKGFLILMFLPLYWLYAIIWFIAFRGRLNNYPRLKKDETSKHLILMALSLFVFAIFGNAFAAETSARENESIIANNKNIESSKFLEEQNKSDNEIVYDSLIDSQPIEFADETESSRTEDISNIEISSSKGISPYYHPPVEEGYYSEPTYYESDVKFNDNYEQTTEKDYDYESNNEDSKISIDNEFIPDNSPSKNDILVWVDDTANKYHSSSDTPNHPNAKMDAPRQVTINEALSMGKEPCRICY